MNDPQAIADALRAILEPGQVTELRAIDAVTRSDRRPHTESGYFDDPDKLAAAVAGITEAQGIYFVLNPCNPALLARAVNRTRNPGKKPTTADHDITARRWLPIDCDPVRPAGISASRAEHAAARERAIQICEDLHSCGFPWPILADSGNGWHLLYRVDLPADDGGLIQRCLQALAARYDDDAVKVDQTVFNPARIWKLYGTATGKGDDTPDRPHRTAHIVKVPEPLELLPREALELLAEQAPSKQAPSTAGTAATRGAINESPGALREYLERCGVTVARIQPGKVGGHVLVLDGCPMNSDHGKGGDTAVVLRADGIVGFKCWHNGCSAYKWPDVRATIDPERSKAKSATTGAKPKTKLAPVERYKPFPLQALPETVRGFAESVAKATGTDPAFAGLAALVTLAGCIGNRVAALVKNGWTEPAVLWGVMVGRSGTTKSPVLKLTTRALVELYKADRVAYADARREYQQEAERYGVRLQVWKAEQRKGPPTDPPEAPEEPREKRLVVADVTVEKLGVLLQQNPLGLLLVRDELAAWIGSFDRYAAGGKGSDCPAWLSMYDAASITIDRKSADGTIFCDRAAVSVLGSIQPGTLARVFGTNEREAGLLGRVLLAYPPDRPAFWTDEELPDDTAAAWRDLISALLAIEPGVDDDGEPRPRLMTLSDVARLLWIGWHDRHARETAEVPSEDLAAHFAKLKGACIRFALVLECVNVVTDGGGRPSISADAMRRAIELVEWFKHEARRLYATLTESDEARELRRLLELIRRTGGIVTVREWQRKRSHPTAADAEAELAKLVEAGCGQWDNPAPGPEGGRPTKRFTLPDTPDNDNTPADDCENGGFVSVRTVNGAADDCGDGRERGEL